MPGTVHQRRQQALRDAVRLRLLAGDARQPLLAHALDLRRVQPRLAQHGREQRERGIEPVLERGQGGGGGVERGAGADRRTEVLGAGGEVERTVGTGALAHHRHRERRSAGLAPRVSGEAGVEHRLHLHHRHLRPTRQHHRHTVRERETLERREGEVRESGDLRHTEAAVDRARGRVTQRAERQHGQRVVALPQPTPRDVAHLRGGRRLDGRERPAEAAGVAVEHLALGEHVGLAAEAADALDAAHEPGPQRGARTIELLLGRALLQQARELLVHRLLDGRGVLTGLDHHLDREQAGDLHRLVEGPHIVRRLIAVHEPGVEP